MLKHAVNNHVGLLNKTCTVLFNNVLVCTCQNPQVNKVPKTVFGKLHYKKVPQATGMHTALYK